MENSAIGNSERLKCGPENENVKNALPRSAHYISPCVFHNEHSLRYGLGKSWHRARRNINALCLPGGGRHPVFRKNSKWCLAYTYVLSCLWR